MNNIDQIISQTSEATATTIISGLKKQGLIKEQKQTAFQKTETLLYNYNNFKAVIADKIEQIKIIREEGLSGKSSSITILSGTMGYDFKSEYERAEEKIESLERSIQVTQNFVKNVEKALESIKEDTYFELIKMKYFEGQTREDIAEYYDVDVSTISRNKNRLINRLQIRLFSDEVICQILGS